MGRPEAKLLAIAIVMAFLAACGQAGSPWPGNLELEEHALAESPEPMPLVFQPLEGTQGEILARHADQRSRTYPSGITSLDGNPAMGAQGDSDELVARLVPSPEDPLRQIVKLFRADEEILMVDAGMPSPALPLQGLWTYGGHWALEVLFSDPDTWIGRIYIDGELANDLHGYDEAFGFQLLDGRPFYFYVRSGSVGFAFDGEEADLGYDEIIHYRCCAESTLNPVQAEDMVAFFGQRDGTWYYAELGRLDS